MDESEKYILNGSYQKFLSILSKGWEQKKKYSKDVLKDPIVKDMDEYLKTYPNCVSHKLCGAGNGGFFLCFFPSDKLPTDSRFFKLTLSTTGVQRIV